MREIKTEYVRIGNRVFMVEFSQYDDGFRTGIEFSIYNPHKQPHTLFGRIIRFFSENCYLDNSVWYATSDYATPLEMAIHCCADIVDKENIIEATEKAWENLDKTP